jgi:long-chain acyl-CoA synthetase
VTPDSAVTEQDLKDHVAARAAAFKVPVRIEIRREPLPRNANGKLLKSQLKREMTVPASRSGSELPERTS